ncbi:hypothetical protein NQ318_010990 [Aromia moschata]|uniref:Uncharacterized protein n=1 Tax=Aromia moschata TaxID=1265417 RepID=A0AAV8YK07_9CUCU|nr:hypothetical protein NQ318_010990 [Aromia moschata]
MKNPTARGRQLLQNVTWKIAGSNASALNYLNIDSDLKMSLNPFNKAMTFYDKIYQDYGEPPYDTY